MTMTCWSSSAYATSLAQNMPSRQCGIADDMQWLGVQAQKKANFKWWVQRMSRAMQLYDLTRIDHFRGFAGVVHDMPLHDPVARCRVQAGAW